MDPSHLRFVFEDSILLFFPFSHQPLSLSGGNTKGAPGHLPPKEDFFSGYTAHLCPSLGEEQKFEATLEFYMGIGIFLSYTGPNR